MELEQTFLLYKDDIVIGEYDDFNDMYYKILGQLGGVVYLEDEGMYYDVETGKSYDYFDIESVLFISKNDIKQNLKNMKSNITIHLSPFIFTIEKI